MCTVCRGNERGHAIHWAWIPSHVEIPKHDRDHLARPAFGIEYVIIDSGIPPVVWYHTLSEPPARRTLNEHESL